MHRNPETYQVSIHRFSAELHYSSYYPHPARVDDSRGTTTGGMGLGLAIANNAIVAHGGGVIARNLEPHGLEIQLLIPQRPHPPAAGESFGPFVMQTVASRP